MYAKIVFRDPSNKYEETIVENTEWSFLEIGRDGLTGMSAEETEGFQCALDHLVSVKFSEIW